MNNRIWDQERRLGNWAIYLRYNPNHLALQVSLEWYREWHGGFFIHIGPVASGIWWESA